MALFTLGGFIAAVVIGAVVGGCVAAISGGDMKSGILMGAVGGAISFGIGWGVSAYMGTTGGTVASSTSSTLGSSARSSSQQLTGVAVKEGVMANGTTQTIGGSASTGATDWGSAISGMFESSGGAGSVLGQAALTIGGNMLAASDAEDMANDQRDWQESENRKAEEYNERISSMNIGAQESLLDKKISSEEGMFSQELAETRRQFDVPLQRMDEDRQLQRDTLAGIRVDRNQGALKGPISSLDQMSADDTQDLLAAKKGELQYA